MRRCAAILVFLVAARGWAQLSAAREAEARGDLPAAERIYEAEVKLHPAAETWQRLGLVRHLQNRYDAAVPAFRQAVRLDPALWTGHLFLGIALYRTNQFESALASLQEADRRGPAAGPGRDEIDYWLGATRIAQKQKLAGLRSLERLLARQPGHVAALELAAQSYGDLSTALWNGVAEHHFETAQGYEVHGHALESEGNAAGALDAYRHSKTLDPRRPGPGLAVGRLLLQGGKVPEALAALEDELKLSPRDPEASYYRGLAAIQLGRWNDALASLEIANFSSSGDPEPAMALAQVYLALHRPAEAAQAAQRAVAAAPASPAAHELLVAALTQAADAARLEQEHSRWRALRKP